MRRTPYIWCPSLPVRKRRAVFIVVEDVIIIIAYRKRFAHIAGDFGFVFASWLDASYAHRKKGDEIDDTEAG